MFLEGQVFQNCLEVLHSTDSICVEASLMCKSVQVKFLAISFFWRFLAGTYLNICILAVYENFHHAVFELAI